jgi:hypothetical protein
MGAGAHPCGLGAPRDFLRAMNRPTPGRVRPMLDMRLLFLALLLASGCSFGRTSARTNATQGNAAQPTGARVSRANLEPREQLDGLIRHLAAQEYRNVGKVLFNRNFAAPQTMVHSLQLPAGRCYVVAGISPHTADLNLTVLGPNGRAVAHDMRRDAHPNVRFCTRVGGRYGVRLQMARGYGGYYLALFEGPAKVNPRVATYFTGHEVKEAGVQAAAIDRATKSRLDALARALQREGYTSVGPTQGLSLGGTLSRDFRLNLRSDRCYVFVTLAGPGVTDADATILTDDHEEIAHGESKERDSLVRFCPPNVDDFTLRARILAGRGAIFVTGFQKPVEGRAVTAAPATSEVKGVIAETSTVSATLDETYALRSSDLAARGYARLGSPVRGEIGQGSEGRYPFTLEAGKCYAVLAVGGEGVASMRLQAEDADGGLLDRDVDGGRTAIVRFCPETAGSKSMVVSMTHGGGPVMVGAFAWPRGTQGPFGLAGVMYVRLAEVMQLLELEGYEPSLVSSPMRGELDREGTKESHSISLEAGRCYALVTVGDEHITDLGLELRRGTQAVASDISRNAFPSVRYCAEQRTDLELVVTAKRGRGAYFYQLFERDPG